MFSVWVVLVVAGIASERPNAMTTTQFAVLTAAPQGAEFADLASQGCNLQISLCGFHECLMLSTHSRGNAGREPPLYPHADHRERPPGHEAPYRLQFTPDLLVTAPHVFEKLR